MIPARSISPLDICAPAAAVAHQKDESPVTRLMAVELVVAVLTNPLAAEPVNCLLAMFVGLVTVPGGRTLTPAHNSGLITTAAVGTAVGCVDATKKTRAFPEPVGL